MNVTTPTSPSERFLALWLSDELLAKAAGVRELALMARLETRLRQFYNVAWRSAVRRAIAAAVPLVALGATPGHVADVVDREMRRWAASVESITRSASRRMYYLARRASFRKIRTRSREPLTYDLPARKIEKAGPAKKKPAKDDRTPAPVKVTPKFDVADAAASKALERNAMFWTGHHYSDNVSAAVRETVRETMVEAGHDRVAAGRALRAKLRETLGSVRAPSGWQGTQAQYFEGLAANAATTARAAGTLRTMADLGVTHYQISNPIDDRTCDVCGHMNDKEFLVEHGQEVLDRELAATNPEDAKAAHPWLSYSKLLEVAPRAGATRGEDSAALARQGFVAPPFHFRCRCSVDISFESGR